MFEVTVRITHNTQPEHMHVTVEAVEYPTTGKTEQEIGLGLQQLIQQMFAQAAERAGSPFHLLEGRDGPDWRPEEDDRAQMENEISSAHAWLDQAGIPREQESGVELARLPLSISERVGLLVGRQEAERRQAWLTGLIGGLVDDGEAGCSGR